MTTWQQEQQAEDDDLRSGVDVNHIGWGMFVAIFVMAIIAIWIRAVLRRK